MAKYTDAKCRLCRREGEKLFLKGKRCLTPKCPIDKRGPVAPGMIGKRRKRTLSEYGLQLREKQKTKRIYGILERQFRKYYEEAKKVSGATGEVLLQKIETRLDNVVFRLGLTGSRVEARQLVSHRHVLVNGKKVNIASYQVKPEDIISLSTKGLEIPYVKETFLQKGAIMVPLWLNRKGPVGLVKRFPKRDEIDSNINEQLVVEYYSR